VSQNSNPANKASGVVVDAKDNKHLQKAQPQKEGAKKAVEAKSSEGKSNSGKKTDSSKPKSTPSGKGTSKGKQ
jgi:hypothetical protein